MEGREIQHRLWQWIDREGVSQRELQRTVNQHLHPEGQVSRGTVANYVTEKAGGDLDYKSPPRADFLAALKAAYPHLNIEWLVTGRGEATVTETELASQTDEERGRLHLRNRVRQRLGADFAMLGSAERELFLETLARWTLTAPDGAGIIGDEAERVVGWKAEKTDTGIRSVPVDEEGEEVREPGVEALLELAEDLLWLVNLPVGSRAWGFANVGRERPGQLRDYRLAMLSALRVLMLGRGQGDPLERAANSPLRRLRRQKEGRDAALREALSPGETKITRPEDDGEGG